MKIFLDTANLDEIKKANATGLLDGVTTNPTLISREKLCFTDQVREISQVTNGPVCLEVISSKAEDIIPEAETLVKLIGKALIKIPAGEEGLKAVTALTAKNIPTVVTLCFSPLQALLAAKAGATYIAPFIGRLDDIGVDSTKIVEQMIQVLHNYNFSTKIIVASVRSPLQVLKMALLGADIVTLPYKVFSMLNTHPLTDIGLEKFISDWEKFNKATNTTTNKNIKE
ncbi:MAG: fructose-6-phosphate aldolase [Spirochaetales bacterium]|nr:fructose-6-phosphate aldolase [Spirochaetales bacterium]